MKILLVEPGYKNKYPPMGLMKISTYHKSKGDYVYFVKGKDKELCSEIWDRVYITTLFTFHYQTTVDTIRFYKKCVLSTDNIFVGGIMASLMPVDLKHDAGIKNVLVGQLTSSNFIGFDDDVNIDNLPLDYDILWDTDYKYPAGDNYFAYTTRGCPNKCSFCAVPLLEPEFKTINSITEQIENTDKMYGQKRNLLLLDNNVLESDELSKIVDDIKKSGFYKGATFTYPNLFNILLSKALQNANDGRYLKRLIDYLNDFKKFITNPKSKAIYMLFIEELLAKEDVLTAILGNAEKINEYHERYKDKRQKLRYVDFNQGIDARLLTEERMKKLSELPLNPLRIAFDHISQKDNYVRAVKLANKYGVNEMSNYILYNHKDKPEHLWDRLKVNIELNEELGVHIFSFPMKYMPIDKTDREHIGIHWKRKYLSAITAILLVTKGIVAGGTTFFEKAFGRNHEEYFNILAMPRDFIIYRYKYEGAGLTEQWHNAFNELTQEEKDWLLDYVGSRVFVEIPNEVINSRLKKALEFYTIRLD